VADQGMIRVGVGIWLDEIGTSASAAPVGAEKEAAPGRAAG
jgi:hypothetical protein